MPTTDSVISGLIVTIGSVMSGLITGMELLVMRFVMEFNRV